MADARSNISANTPDSKNKPAPVFRSKSNAQRKSDEPAVKIHAAPPETRPRSMTVLDPDTPDDLTRIRRINRELADKLRRTGITHFEQIAEWSATDVRSLSAALKLGNAIYQQGWIEQAAQLALARSKTATTAIAQPTSKSDIKSKPSIASLISSAAAAIRTRGRYRESFAKNREPIDTLQIALTCPDVEPEEPAGQPDPTAILYARISERFRELAVGLTSKATKSPVPLQNVVYDQPKVPAPAIRIERLKPGPFSRHPLPTVSISTSPALVPTTISEPKPSPKTEAKPATRDDLTLIADLSPRVAGRLNEVGILYFSEIADFDADDIATLSIDCNLGDRVSTECWVEQAAMLAAGVTTSAARKKQSGSFSNDLASYPPPQLKPYRKAFTALTEKYAVKPQIANLPDTFKAPPRPVPIAIKAAASSEAKSGHLLDEPRQPPSIRANKPVTVQQLASAKVGQSLVNVSDRNEDQSVDTEPVGKSVDPPSAAPVLVTSPEPPPVPFMATPIPAASLRKARDEIRNTIDSIDCKPAVVHDIPEPAIQNYDFEEAEVSIKSRGQMGRHAVVSDANDAAKDFGASDEASNSPGSSEFKGNPFDEFDYLDDLSAPPEDDEDLTGYLNSVEEASVEIVAAGPAQRRATGATAHKLPAEGRKLSPQAAKEPKPRTDQTNVARFLKALKGR